MTEARSMGRPVAKTRRWSVCIRRNDIDWLTLQEEEADNGHKSEKHGVSVTESVGSPTGNLETKDLTDLSTSS